MGLLSKVLAAGAASKAVKGARSGRGGVGRTGRAGGARGTVPASGGGLLGRLLGGRRVR